MKGLDQTDGHAKSEGRSAIQVVRCLAIMVFLHQSRACLRALPEQITLEAMMKHEEGFGQNPRDPCHRGVESNGAICSDGSHKT